MSETENVEETVAHGSYWQAATLFGILSGAVVGGCGLIPSLTKHAKGLLESESRKVGMSLEEMDRILIEMDRVTGYGLRKESIRNTNQFIRSHGSIFGLTMFGMYFGSYVGMQNYLAEKLGVQDVYNYLGAGPAAAETLGLTYQGSLASRLRAVMIATAVGVVVAFPLSRRHLKMIDKSSNPNRALQNGEGSDF